MSNIANIHSKLTSNMDVDNSKHLVLEFAKELGWTPSYFIEPSSVERSNGYLVVEHGLQNSAIISFLKGRNEDLTSIEEENLLSLSYNNLVNWHITIDSREINFYFILNKEKDKRKVETKKIVIGNEQEALSVTTFYEVIGKKPNPNIKALDDVLIDNISNWKRIISAELGNNIDLVSLSHLFNSIIFLRSIEDSKKRANEINSNTKAFIDVLESESLINVTEVLSKVEERLNVIIPDHIVQKSKIKIFEVIGAHELKRLFNSFYENEYNRFKYDFSIMTKQALSRIYQKYVSILSLPDLSSSQNLFELSPILSEKISKDTGAYYTPEYIARFFAKYICKSYTEKEFDSLQILEPAVGSGIFLRTLLETQIEQRIANETELNIDQLFKNVCAIDIDPNACLSTNLSLTLLHYIFKKTFSQPNVIEGDSLEIMQSKIKKGESVDLVISNPPYINQDNKSHKITEKYKALLHGLNNGKIDIYQVFIKLSIDILKPNGLGLFVLPHNFLSAESSKKLRNYLLENCTIESIADLSSINVFDKVSTYTMLLIFRKKSVVNQKNPNSWILKCRASVGEALNQLLTFQESEHKHYQIYKVENYFKTDANWFLLNKSEFDLLSKIQRNRNINDFLSVNQGIVTGKDSVFKRDKKHISKEEKIIYKSFLPDKEINSFISYPKNNELVFYPYFEDEIITEEKLVKKFPQTWKYLNENKQVLEHERADVKSGKLIWWKLHSPGKPKYVNAPKIITPYLSIFPKFAIDIEGELITFRSPYFILKEMDTDINLLYYFLGILNSTPCYWALSLQSHKQSSGYNIFHLNILKNTPIPDPTLAEHKSLVSKMILTVKRRIAEKNEIKKMEMEVEINKIACELYQLSPKEMELLGV